MAVKGTKATRKSISVYPKGFLPASGKSKEGYLASTRKLASYPEMYLPDKYSKEKSGFIRAMNCIITE